MQMALSHADLRFCDPDYHPFPADYVEADEDPDVPSRREYHVLAQWSEVAHG